MESSSTCTRLEQLKCRGSLSVIEDGIRKTESEFGLSGSVDMIDGIYLVADLERLDRVDMLYFADIIASISRETYIKYNYGMGNELRFTVIPLIRNANLEMKDVFLRVVYSGKGSEHAKIFVRGHFLSPEDRSDAIKESKSELTIASWASIDYLHREMTIPVESHHLVLDSKQLSSGIDYPLRCNKGGEGISYTYELPRGPYILQYLHITTPYSCTITFDIGSALTYSKYIKSRPLGDKESSTTYKISPMRYHSIMTNSWCVKLYKMPFSGMRITISEMYGRLMKDPPMVCANLVRIDSERIKTDTEEEFVELEDGITVKYSQGFLKIHKIETLEERQARQPRGEDW